jgi:isoaspartyl peptidase/L-asparaginase-like protein (Ntn-hydrolase superfamily)
MEEENREAGIVEGVEWIDKPILNAKAIMSDDTVCELRC